MNVPIYYPNNPMSFDKMKHLIEIMARGAQYTEVFHNFNINQIPTTGYVYKYLHKPTERSIMTRVFYQKNAMYHFFDIMIIEDDPVEYTQLVAPLLALLESNGDLQDIINICEFTIL